MGQPPEAQLQAGGRGELSGLGIICHFQYRSGTETPRRRARLHWPPLPKGPPVQRLRDAVFPPARPRPFPFASHAVSEGAHMSDGPLAPFARGGDAALLEDYVSRQAPRRSPRAWDRHRDRGSGVGSGAGGLRRGGSVGPAGSGGERAAGSGVGGQGSRGLGGRFRRRLRDRG